MKIAVVGSRTFPQPTLVEWFVDDLPKGVTIISGGAIGVDQCAAKRATEKGLEVIQILPDISTCKERWEFTKAYQTRNQRIVDDADLVVAFTEKQKGGTWDTIKRARKANKPVKIIKPTLFFPSTEREEENQQEKTDDGGNDNKRLIGKGPFQVKNIGLGSYALKLWRYIDPVDWADFINAKDNDPEKCSRLMSEDFLNFFMTHQYGKIHTITQAPKSIRHTHKPHPMDFVCQYVSEKLDIPYVEMFEAWDKKSRGRHAQHPEIVIKETVKDYVGKVVYILDDVTLTHTTLRSCVKALCQLEIHAHGIAWVMYS